MNPDSMRICKHCQFVLPEDSEKNVCPNCGSEDIMPLSSFQEPLASVDVLSDWFERLEPEFRSKLIDLFALAGSEEEKKELILKLSRPNRKASKSKEIELILNSDCFEMESDIFEKILDSVIYDATEKSDKSAILLLEKAFSISFPILRRKFAETNFKYTKTYSDGLKKFFSEEPPRKNKNKKLRKTTRARQVKPHFTTDEFDAAMTSNRGMDNIPASESEINNDHNELISESTAKKIKNLLAKGLTAAAIAYSLNIPETEVYAVNQQNPIPIEQTENINNVIDILARTIYAEAEGEPYRGKLGVASVIWNRAKGDPSKFIQVIRRPKQFSPWDNGRIPPRGNGIAWDESLSIARKMVNGEFVPIFGYTHFLNPELVIKRYGKLPIWAREQHNLFTSVKKDSLRIGKHVFLFDR